MRVIRRGLIVCALAAGLALRVVHAQAPQPDPAITEFVMASDADRLDMFAKRPQIGGVPFRQAIGAQGFELGRRGDFAMAERYYKAVLWIAEQQQSDEVRAIAFINLARISGQQGDLAAAQDYARDALTLAEKVNDTDSVQSAAANLGIIQRRLGDPVGALDSFRRAYDLAVGLKLEDNAARVLNNIGLAYFDLGDLALARDYLDRSLAIKMKLDDGGRITQDIASGLSNIGMLYTEVGDFAQALDHFNRAIELLMRSGGGPFLSSALGNSGNVLARMGDRVGARDRLMRALAIAEQQGDKSRIATIHYLVASLERSGGDYAAAEQRQRHVLAMREEIGESLALVESLNELSSLMMATKRPAEALEFANRAVSLGTDARLSNRLWKSQMAKADALAALQREPEAVAMYQAGIDGIEAVRQRTAGGDRSRQMYLGERSGPYYGLARLHAESGRPFEGLLALERARARTLLDVLSLGRKSSRSLTPAQQTRERELTQAVISASLEIDSLLARRKYEESQLKALEQKLSRARLERDAFMTSLYHSTPDLRLARGDAPIITRQGLAVLVKPSTAIVSIVMDNMQVWAYVITKGAAGVSITAHQVNSTSSALAALADQFSKQVATRDLGFSANARKLYDLLFVDTKIEPLLNGKSQLIMVPEGPLWRVPFQALQTPRETFLIEERAISYAPSVSALAALDQRRRSRDQRQPYLLALGDPALAVRTESVMRGGPVRGRLPQAAREVKALGQLYGEAKSRVLVAEDATEAALRDNLGRASVVHVATHGVLDDLSPMYSHVLLAPKNGLDSGEDGRLEAWEMMNLPLDVDLAVLSACETARGPIGDGEGVIGLSWSLFAAGASTAVVSQWEVDSASTTALMIAFHERLLLSPRNGRDPVAAPEALRVAAMRLMRGPAYRHPFYWAGFVVIGAS